jgi:hypothetical protein
VRVRVTEDSIEIELATWEKALGLMKDIRLPLSDLSDVCVVEKPMREVRGSGLKAGLRLPGIRYVARTIRLDQAFLLKRGERAVSFSVHGHEPLQSVTVSAPDAPRLAKQLRGGRGR